jgi:hypothetical protein
MIPIAGAGGRQTYRLLRPCIQRAAATPGADRYRKHFPAAAHLWILLLHGLWGSSSLRQTYATLLGVPRGFARLGLPAGISFSQLARSSTSRPGQCFETVLAELSAQARRAVRPDPTWRLLRKVQIVDSTFLTLSAQLSPWSRHGRHAPGVRLHSAIDLARHLPTRVWLTGADCHDYADFARVDLSPYVGWTVLLDRGYYGHRLFARLQTAGVSFLCRMQPQAHYHVLATRTVSAKPTPDGDVLLHDRTIRLGSANNRRGAVLGPLRLVTSRNRTGQRQQFLTDRFDLTAAELVRLYRKRWQIELFFRFLKHQLTVATPLGYSRAAVWLTVLLATIIALLMTLLDPIRPAALSRIAWLRACARALQPHFRGS